MAVKVWMPGHLLACCRQQIRQGWYLKDLCVASLHNFDRSKPRRVQQRVAAVNTLYNASNIMTCMLYGKSEKTCDDKATLTAPQRSNRRAGLDSRFHQSLVRRSPGH